MIFHSLSFVGFGSDKRDEMNQGAPEFLFSVLGTERSVQDNSIGKQSRQATLPIAHSPLAMPLFSG